MIDVSLFLATVLIWGTTWIGIAMQVDSAPVRWSRCFIAFCWPRH